jgi:hypothetical protein
MTKKTKKNNIPLGYKLDEITDNPTLESYNHFKNLIYKSPNLCISNYKNKKYKVHVSLHKTLEQLLKKNHHKIWYIHNDQEIVAFISMKLYMNTGNFLFIHKLCSSLSGLGSYLMKKAIEYANTNKSRLNITYMSLTTHNLDLVEYYNKFNPTEVWTINTPQSKAKNPKKVAYMIWQVDKNMPHYTYK